MLVASILSLLAFILGFTFDQAEAHFDLRRESVLQEALALGRAFKLTDLLEEPERAGFRRMILDYIDARLEINRSGNVEATAVTRIRALQDGMWTKVTALERNGAHASSLLNALSEAFDIYGERALVGHRARIPSRVWLALYLIMTVAVGAAGYVAGISGSKKALSSFAYAFVFSAVIVMIVAGDVPGPAQFEKNRQTLSDLRVRLLAFGE
jgi:hypothetical protein